MILSEHFKKTKSGKIIVTQKVKIKCDQCNFELSSSLLNQIEGVKKYGMDLCRGCKQKEQYRLGLRDKQKEHIRNYATKVQKGKTYEELYAPDKVNSIKNKLSKSASDNNPRWSLKYRTYDEINKDKKKLGKRITDTRKGKSYDEIYGYEKSLSIKNKLSSSFKGEKNHMYGKPAPKGSGGGIDGWYDDFYFRSLLELSFLIDMSNKGITVMSAENNTFKVPYEIDGVIKNYFPDFYLPDENLIIEIKPFCRISEHINSIKFKAANKTFDNFKVLSERDFKKIAKDELLKLVNNNIVRLRNNVK